MPSVAPAIKICLAQFDFVFTPDRCKPNAVAKGIHFKCLSIFVLKKGDASAPSYVQILQW